MQRLRAYLLVLRGYLLVLRGFLVLRGYLVL
jgi:hypothetical protein